MICLTLYLTLFRGWSVEDVENGVNSQHFFVWSLTGLLAAIPLVLDDYGHNQHFDPDCFVTSNGLRFLL
eukprot:UN28857